MKSSRICEIEKRTTDNNPYRTKAHFVKDYHYAGLHLYNECELWEKIARSMAYAIVNQDYMLLYSTDNLDSKFVEYFQNYPYQTPSENQSY